MAQGCLMAGYDKEEHVKETFAYFGRAYYMANVFEEGLGNAILQLDFLKQQLPLMRKAGMANFDRKKYEAEFDVFVASNQAKTLGNLIKRVFELAEFEPEFNSRIAEAKRLRDFLAHQFFRERAEAFATRSGRDQMIEELDRAHGIFENADRDLDSFMGPFLSRSGVKNEKVHKHFEAYIDNYIASFSDDG